MMQRREFLICAFTGALAPCLTTSVASAVERKAFDAESFAAAQRSGTRILVDITATWCPTCKAQKPIIDSLVTRPENNDLVTFSVDFDLREPVLSDSGERRQRTVLRGIFGCRYA